VTEVPEYLLARSRERRAAMGGGGDAGETEAPPAASAEAAPAAATPAPVPAAAIAPAEPADPEPVPPYVEAAERRKRMPVWVVPVMVCLPIWAIYYVGTLERPPQAATGLLGEGEEVYASSCAGCHGGGGGGGVGPQLSEGEVLLTFPDLPSHISWVINGSPAVDGTPYGDPARAGGQRQSEGGMAGWGESLSAEELLGVVHYERVTHGGLEADVAAAELELLEAFIETGAEFEGGESPRDIGAALAELGGETAEGEGEEASG